MPPAEVGRCLIVDPGVCEGQLAFKGTRLTVSSLLHRLAQGRSVESVLEANPEVSRDALMEAFEAAARALEEKYPPRQAPPERVRAEPPPKPERPRLDRTPTPVRVTLPPGPVADLVERKQFAAALALLEEPSSEPRDFKTLVSVRQLWKAHVEQAAHQRIQEESDFAAAVALLEEVPERMRNTELLAEYRAVRDRLARLETDIQEDIRAQRTAWLRLKLEPLLELAPQHRWRDLLRTLPEIPRRVINSVGMQLLLIPQGTFRMGSPEGELERVAHEGPRHEVEITRPFYLGVYPVTQDEYEKVMGVNPSHFRGDRRLPVEQVNWQEAADFCTRLSALPEEKRHNRVYRLPTEAEWEYACRGAHLFPDESAPFYLDRPAAALDSTQANCNGQCPYGGAPGGRFLQKTTPVGSFPANPLGLYDMHGNVWEWCGDIFEADYYQNSPRVDPQGPQNKRNSRRVLRGGCWLLGAAACRAASRYRTDIMDRHDVYGLRVVLIAS